MKNSYLVYIIILFSIILQSCAQKNNSKRHSKISKQDSTKLMVYLDSVGQFPLFSYKRQQYLDSALTIVPGAAELWQQKAMPLFKQKKYEIGMSYLDSSVKYDKTNHYLEYRAFIKCIFQKSYKESIKDFELVRQRNGNSYIMDHPYEFYIGLCYLQLNQIDSAQHLIIKCINEERKKYDESRIHHLHLFYLGIIFYEKGDYTKALTCFDSALKKYPQFCDAQYYKAVCLKQLQGSKPALELLIKAKENLKQGYTINEDNAIYETYPYQINRYMLDGYIEILKQPLNN